MYIPKPGDKITMTDDQIEEQKLSLPVIKAIYTKGYCTVQSVDPIDIDKTSFAITPEEDPAMTIWAYRPFNHRQ